MSRRFGAAILGCAGTTLSPDERCFFARAQPFGFILFARNVADAAQLGRLTEDLRAAVGWNAPILVDQEGGRVQRLRPPLARDWPPPLDHAETLGPRAERGFYLRYRLLAAELLRYGIDVNCAPMLDVARTGTHAFLRNRCYGDTLDRVVTLGRAVARAHLDAGVLPVIKHMPGHGLGTLDSHHEVPRISAPRASLDTLDFAAFRPFADLPLGMTGHLLLDDVDPDRPATVSPVVIDLIRRDIGFGGFLMTDDISMQALSGSVPDRGAAALAAGCDAVLHCNGDLAEMEALMARIGAMTPAAQARAEAALAARPTPADVDIAALEHEFRALTEAVS